MSTLDLDPRLGRTRTHNAPWTLTPPADLPAWRARAAYIRDHILTALGLIAPARLAGHGARRPG